MLLVSGLPKAGSGVSATLARARSGRVAGADVDPKVAIKFWHTRCEVEVAAPAPAVTVPATLMLLACSAKIT